MSTSKARRQPQHPSVLGIPRRWGLYSSGVQAAIRNGVQPIVYGLAAGN